MPPKKKAIPKKGNATARGDGKGEAKPTEQELLLKQQWVTLSYPSSYIYKRLADNVTHLTRNLG